MLVTAVTAWLCVVSHAIPLPNAADVFGIDAPQVRDEEFLSPHFALSRSKPTTQPLPDAAEVTLAVCDSTSAWVADKQTAVDIRGRNVTVLSELQTPHGRLKQYFFETKCTPRRGTAGRCRGVDRNYWISECQTTQTYVRAFTMDSKKAVAWRFVRIDAGCACKIRPQQQDAVEYGGQETS
ncbi:brain-derived neurotrophic factor-like [Lacerta agilis]|uniref:brain-derived neurotrophic factor-like n=1 Tax=Lacerta agilis TaxID=80427 RepID=UPI0014196AAD|nr:brain-derived neurotrophic factor-like [Lacerta agilis]XP_033026407.1 brain-derived neurotrophic factor-like [Lacerta agilis]